MHRTAPAMTAMLTPAAVAPDDRPQIHNTSIDDQLAATGACSQVHLPTGRTAPGNTAITAHATSSHAKICRTPSPPIAPPTAGDRR